jgi:hypothetical protein
LRNRLTRLLIDGVTRRGDVGSATVELPICLLILLLLFLFPMLDLAVCGLRSTTVDSVARDAARVAGRAASFTSAKTLAVNQAKLTESKSMAGTAIDTAHIVVTVIATPVAGGAATRSTSPIASAGIDATAYVYQIEVDVPATVQPLVTLSAKVFGSVPGLTVPMKIHAVSREFVEHPLGLSQ